MLNHKTASEAEIVKKIGNSELKITILTLYPFTHKDKGT